MYLTFYVDSLPDGFAGKANGPVIRILKKYKDDQGLLAHEKVHVRQWWMTLGLHSILYLLSDRYKLWAEVEAYKEQLKHTPSSALQFAGFIAEKYGLDVSVNKALELLNQK